MRYVTMLTQNETMGAATASDGEHAPIASFWVRIMTSCVSIKRGVLRKHVKLTQCHWKLLRRKFCFANFCAKTRISWVPLSQVIYTISKNAFLLLHCYFHELKKKVKKKWPPTPPPHLKITSVTKNQKATVLLHVWLWILSKLPKYPSCTQVQFVKWYND